MLVTAPDRGPIARTFTTRIEATTGIPAFRRGEEETQEMPPFGIPELSQEGELSIPYALESGPSGTLRIRVERETLRYSFALAEGNEANSIAMPFACPDASGGFYGFGEQYNGTNQRGEAFDLIVGEQGISRTGGVGRGLTGDAHTTYFPMPYWLDPRGFGVLFHTDRRTLVDLCTTDEDIAWIEVESGAPLEWTVFTGPTPLDVVEQLSAVVGRPAPLPDWAFGLWVAAQGGRDAVLAEADALEAADIDASALWVQDWTGIRMNLGGGFGVEYRWEADDELYPELPQMVADLRERGYRFLAYANPFIATELENHFPEMAANGLLIQNSDGEPYEFFAPNGTSSHADLTNEAARDYVRDALVSMINTYGFDGWMHDFAEWTPFDAVLSDGSDAHAFRNRYPEFWQQLAREAMEIARPDGDFVYFARSGWTGVQGAAQLHWAGDQQADFTVEDGLPTVVPALLNMGISGQPHVTHDIAGFSGGPSTKELFLRWTELGAFTPVMRTHEGDDKLENWSWERDEETTAHFRRFARVHDALSPLFRRLADEAQESSAPILRHLLFHYPEDQEACAVSDQFLIGDELLVAPVTAAGATSRSVYLPEGTWFDVWTGEELQGPMRVDREAPIGQPPVFSRDMDRTDLRAIE